MDKESEEILDSLIDKWKEHIEMSPNPSSMIIGLLLNTIKTQNSFIEYLQRALCKRSK